MRRMFVVTLLSLGAAGCAQSRSALSPPDKAAPPPVAVRPVPSLDDTVNRGLGNSAVIRTAIKDPDDPRWSGRAPASASAGNTAAVAAGPGQPNGTQTEQTAGGAPATGPVAGQMAAAGRLWRQRPQPPPTRSRHNLRRARPELHPPPSRQGRGTPRRRLCRVLLPTRSRLRPQAVMPVPVSTPPPISTETSVSTLADVSATPPVATPVPVPAEAAPVSPLPDVAATPAVTTPREVAMPAPGGLPAEPSAGHGTFPETTQGLPTTGPIPVPPDPAQTGGMAPPSAPASTPGNAPAALSPAAPKRFRHGRRVSRPTTPCWGRTPN